MFCVLGHVFVGTEGVGSRFHVLPARTCFQRKRGCRVPFLCFALPESFNAVPRASGTIFMFCALGLIFGGTEDVGSHFSYFARENSFSAVSKASAPVFIFCVPGLIFGGTEGVGSHFLVLRSRTHLRRFRYSHVLFSCFSHPDTSSAVSRGSCPIFLFYAPRVISRGIEGVGSLFHVLRTLTRFRRYRVRRVPFSCFVRSDTFSAVSRASGPVFIFCAPGHVFGGNEGVEFRFHVLRSRTRF
jgi:hypothetical protein